MAGVGQDKDSGLPSSSMVSSVPALAHDGKQPTQIARNSGDDNTDSCVVHEEITDAAQNEVADKVVQNSIVSEVGMAFESEKKAFDMYNTYVGQVGFSVRKSHKKRRADKTLRQKYLVCSSEGHQQTESSKDTTRTDYDARVQFSVSREGIWTVQKVVLAHNHYLASPNKREKLRSQRSVQELDRKLIGQIREAGLKPSQVFEAGKKIKYRLNFL